MALGNSDSETNSLKLLKEVQSELNMHLNVLVGQSYSGTDNYLASTSALICKTAEGYAFLRGSGRIDSSKLLIRPILEAAYRLLAMDQKPEIFFRIAHAEYLEDRKPWADLKTPDAVTMLKTLEQDWDEFKTKYSAANPDHSLNESKKISVYKIAEAGKATDSYRSHYWHYCGFTHASYRASTGRLNYLEYFDNRTVIYAVLVALGTVAKIGAPVTSDLKARWDELNNLC